MRLVSTMTGEELFEVESMRDFVNIEFGFEDVKETKVEGYSKAVPRQTL